jgi:hypothetical protein
MSKTAKQPRSAAGRNPASLNGSDLSLRISLVKGPSAARPGKERKRITLKVRGEDTLSRLHRAIFDAFGYDDAERLYLFCFGDSWQTLEGRCFSEVENNRAPQPGEPQTWLEDAAKTTLDQLGLKAGQKFSYWFDFGADWVHSVEVLKSGTPG